MEFTSLKKTSKIVFLTFEEANLIAVALRKILDRPVIKTAFMDGNITSVSVSSKNLFKLGELLELEKLKINFTMKHTSKKTKIKFQKKL